MVEFSDLPELKQQAKKLNELIKQMERAKELAKGFDFGKPSVERPAPREPGSRVAHMADFLVDKSKLGTVLNLTEQLGEGKYDAPTIHALAQRVAPAFAKNVPVSEIATLLDKLYRKGEIVRVRLGKRGRGGTPAMFGSAKYYENGEDDE